MSESLKHIQKHIQREYIPIDCSFYDRIEYYAVRREPVLIRFKDEEGKEREIRMRIADTKTGKAGEFAILEDGSSIRMDHIISLNGIDRPLPGDTDHC